MDIEQQRRLTVTPGMAAGLDSAIEAAGDRAKLAYALELNRSAVSRWKKVPAEWCGPIERLFGVPREILRPDLFGEEAE